MRKLDFYKKNGFYYELLKREGDFAIFRQQLRPGEGALAYETIVIRSYESYYIKDKLIEAAEYAPSNEDFGKFGWSFPNLKRAEEKFNWLLKNWNNNDKG